MDARLASFIDEVDNDIAPRAKESFLSMDGVYTVMHDLWNEESNILRQQCNLQRKRRKYRTVLKNYTKLQKAILSFNRKYCNEQS